MRRPSHPRKRDSGLTLVELMVTLVVASLVTASTFMFFAGQKQVYETQTKLLNVQQNLWASMEAVTRHVRAAGTGMVGCVRPDPDGAGPLLPDPPPGSVTPPATGIRVAIPFAPPPAPYPAGTTRLAPMWIQNGGPNDPDALTVVYGEGASGNFVDGNLMTEVNDGNDAIRVDLKQARSFTEGEMILLVDNTGNPLGFERGCTLFRITGIDTATDTLAHAAGAWNPVGANPALFPAPPGYNTPVTGVRNFGQLRWVRFAIDATGPVPMLTMHRLDIAGSTPQVLAEGIEDLQIAYACDLQPAAGPDGILSEGTTAASRIADEWVFNEDLEALPPAACNRPQAVRITLIARSSQPDDTLAALDNRRPRAEDRVQGPDDNFRHRVLQTTIYPRN